MNKENRPLRCHYCGCVLTCRVQLSRSTLATGEQQRAMMAEALAAGIPIREFLRARLPDYGYREYSSASYACPGCGGRLVLSLSEYTQEDAEALAVVQNRAAETPEAIREAANWVEAVRRQAIREARYFADLLLSRFPEWEPYLQFRSPSTPDEGGGQEPEWDCALIARIPFPNPVVDEPLELLLRCSEVRPSWGGDWHTHVTRWPDGNLQNLQHLHDAWELIEGIATEQAAIGITYRGERAVAGGCTPIGEELPAWAQPDQLKPDERIVLRSWRGTYDRVIWPEREGGTS